MLNWIPADENNIDEIYFKIVDQVLNEGRIKEARQGLYTYSKFNVNYEVDLRHGFPMLTTKEINWKNIVIENLWFLSGENSVKFLHKHNTHFWDDWVNDEGLIPSAYGYFWRRFPSYPIMPDDDFRGDQLAEVIKELRVNPDSRRLVVSAWYPKNALFSELPPCHLMFIFNTQYDENGIPILNLHLTQRSCDIGLGLPYNIAGYAFILSLVAHMTKMKPGIFAHTLIDAHIYGDKINKKLENYKEYSHIAGLTKQASRVPRRLPKLIIDDNLVNLKDVQAIVRESSTEEILEIFRLTGYNPHPPIKLKAAVY